MKKTRILALATALLVGTSSLTAFSSCGKKKKNSDYDPNKANLYVATYNGGVGMDWLHEAAARFEERYADATNFENGKTGVKIHVEGDKTTYKGGALETAALNKDVYFTEGVEYFKFVNDGKVANISDVVKGSLSAYGESGTIEAKLDPLYKSYLTAKDNEYYMLPFYDGFYGFSYDVDLFENKGFYIDAEGDYIKLASFDSREAYDAAKSNGPDGEHGTYDDGLPATYEELIALVQYISTQSCIPFCYSGVDYDYVDKAFRSYIVDYEGYDNFMVNYTLNGTVDVVTGLDDNGNAITEKLAITDSNYQDLKKQPGRYYAMKMQKELFGTPTYVGGDWNGLSYTGAQKEFIKSTYDSTPYAILVEGVWWENEATTAFADMETLHGESRADRRFAFMPIPKADASKAGGQTMLSANKSYCFINAETSNMDLAKEFLRFLHTDAEMSKFSARTSIPRSLNYTVTAEDRANASSYGKSIIDMRAGAKVVYPFSSNSTILDNPDLFDERAWFVDSSVYSSTSPFETFKNHSEVTAYDYFLGMYNA